MLLSGAVRADDSSGNRRDDFTSDGGPGAESRGADSVVESSSGGHPRSGPSDTVAPDANDMVGVEIAADPDGTFRARGQINDRDVVLLFDTTSSLIAIPDRLKATLKLTRGSYAPLAKTDGSAGGYSTRIELLEIGPLRFAGVPGWLDTEAGADAAVILGVNGLPGVRFERGDGKLILILSQTEASGSTSGTASDGVPALKRRLEECHRPGAVVDRMTLECMEGR